MGNRVDAVAADLFKALAHPLRLAVIRFLGDEERCVCEIVEALGLRQPTASKHLAILHAQGLIHRRREGSRVLYQVAPGAASILASGVEFANRRRRAEAALLLEDAPSAAGRRTEEDP